MEEIFPPRSEIYFLAETQSKALQEELRSLEYQKAYAFTAPLQERIAHRLENLKKPSTKYFIVGGSA